jgi:ribonuclease HI
VSVAFRWLLWGYNDQGKEVVWVCNKGSLGEFETTFDKEMEAIADIMEYTIDDQIPGDLTIDSDAHKAIWHDGHTGIGARGYRILRAVHAVQYRLRQGWHIRIKWVRGQSGIVGNERADQLAGKAA